MVLCNYAEMTLTAKIVYYGPGLGGKTTNLNHIHNNTLREARGEMVSLNTDTERTLFFDLLPVAAGALGGFKAQIQLYTVPGQVFYNAMRKIVLNGADGIVFVADSQRSVQEVNRQSFENLKANLKEAGLGLHDVPLVLQYNKRDLPEVLTVEELNALLNPEGEYEWFEASAAQGRGVFETLEGISKLTFRAVRERFLGEEKAAGEAGAAAPPALPAPGPEAQAAAGAKSNRHRSGRKRGTGPRGPSAPPPADDEAEPLPVMAPTTVQLALEAPAPAGEPAVEAPAAESAEEDWEISFGDDQAGRRRRDLNLMAELEKLRIHVGGAPTSPRPDNDRKPKSAEPAAALDQLVADTLRSRPKPSPAKTGERGLPSAFQFDVSLAEPDRSKLRRLVLLLQPEGASHEPLGPPQEYVVDLESARDAETVLLSLKVQLKGPRS